MFETNHLSRRDRATVEVALRMRARVLQGRTRTGLAALIAGVSYLLVPLVTDGTSIGTGPIAYVFEMILLMSAIVSVLAMGVWLWIDYRARQALLGVGLDTGAVNDLWKLNSVDLEKVKRRLGVEPRGSVSQDR